MSFPERRRRIMRRSEVMRRSGVRRGFPPMSVLGGQEGKLHCLGLRSGG